jgi:hypothetical protein
LMRIDKREFAWELMRVEKREFSQLSYPGQTRTTVTIHNLIPLQDSKIDLLDSASAVKKKVAKVR